MVAIWITDKIAHKFGKKENSIENLRFPGFLKMFEDNITATSTLMLVFFGTIMVILGEDFMQPDRQRICRDNGFSSVYFDSIIIFYRISPDPEYGRETFCR